MRFYRRSAEIWWCEFEHNGERHQFSTRVRNRRRAEEIGQARRLQIIRQTNGLQEATPEPITLRQFRKHFLQLVTSNHDDHVETRGFYVKCFDRLLEFPELADAQLREIDSAMIDRFKIYMHARVGPGKPVGKTTVNRYLATLRKALHHACDALNLIARVPKIRTYPKSSTCERQREFVFSHAEYQRWLDNAPQPLRDASILARECGICSGELRALERDCVSVLEEADERGLWGKLRIKRGLKREARARVLPITPAMRDVFRRQLARSRCKHIFSSVDNPKRPLSDHTLSGQARDMKRKVEFHHDAGMHALRHTYLTEMGERTDPFTLRKIAGHASIQTTMRYVHPQEEAITRAVAGRIADS